MPSLTRDQFLQACAGLTERGYRKNYGDNETPQNELHHYFKTITRKPDRYGDMRSTCVVMFKIWNFEQYADRMPDNRFYSLEPVVMISRDVDERIDLHLAYPKRTVDEIEGIAAKFAKWVDENVKEL